MSIDRDLLIAACARGPVVRVVIAAHQGSSPREAGAAMVIGADRQFGTIGGGALEHAATARAHSMLDGGGPLIERVPLGPDLGQCCGGAVTLVFERFTAESAAALPRAGLHARAVSGDAGAMPLAVARALRAARGEGWAGLVWRGGWLVEPVAPPRRAVWIWGAGHVGRALVDVLHPLPGLALTWVDTAPQRFPDSPPPGVTLRPEATPALIVAEAPRDAAHLVVTYSHALDLELCHRLLGHGFGWAGLIGSATKWARFRGRLRALGHGEARIARITCPIGAPELGKHPQAIAIGVAAQLLTPARAVTHQEVRQ